MDEPFRFLESQEALYSRIVWGRMSPTQKGSFAQDTLPRMNVTQNIGPGHNTSVLEIGLEVAPLLLSGTAGPRLLQVWPKDEDVRNSGGPVVRTLSFNCRTYGFDPWLEK